MFRMKFQVLIGMSWFSIYLDIFREKGERCEQDRSKWTNNDSEGGGGRPGLEYTNHGIYDHLYAFTLKSCPMKWPYTVICTLSSCFLRFASAKYILLLMKQWKEKNKYIRKEEIRRCVNPDIGGFYILFVKYSTVFIWHVEREIFLS